MILIVICIMITTHQFLSFISFSCFLFATAFGYKIDKSCTDEGVETDIQDAMTSAFEMVDAAIGRLTASPLDQNTVDLLGHLFARPGQDPSTAVTAKTVDTFTYIRQYYRNEIPRNQPISGQDLASTHHHLVAALTHEI
jgi:hypothetical protein